VVAIGASSMAARSAAISRPYHRVASRLIVNSFVNPKLEHFFRPASAPTTPGGD
jgi:hypothetical protein